MMPAERERLARTRYTILSALRASGIVLMLLGMWIWHGNYVRAGGWPEIGAPLFLLGMVDSLVLPVILAKRWRTPDGR